MITELLFHPSVPHLVLSTSADGSARLWDAARNAAPPLVLPPSAAAAMVMATQPTQSWLISCAWNGAGTVFAIGSADFSARVFRLELTAEAASGGVPEQKDVAELDQARSVDRIQIPCLWSPLASALSMGARSALLGDRSAGIARLRLHGCALSLRPLVRSRARSSAF